MGRRPRDKRENSKVCYKCGGHVNIQFHHYYPKTKWHYIRYGKYLCKNCHKEVHTFMGWKTYRTDGLKAKAWYFQAFVRWIAGLSLLYLAIYLVTL